jgi:predicted protein tyrosine phosphatase
MEFLVYDRRSIERGIVVHSAYILVSIRDPDKAPVRYRRPPALRGVLSLAFHDAEPASGLRLPPNICLMQRDDAVKIWEFVQQHRKHVGTIVCHCEQGMSRSPAVAVALAEVLGGDADTLRAESQPNQYTYELMRDTIWQLRGET